MRSRTILASCTILVMTACSSTIDLDEPLAREVRVAVTKEGTGPIGPTSLNFLAMWPADAATQDGLVCGEYEAPPVLKPYRSTLKFVYSRPTNWVDIEKHELLAGDPTTMAIVAQNRTVFAQLWDTSCSATAPLLWRISRWMRS